MMLKILKCILVSLIILLGETGYSQITNQTTATGQIFAEVIPVFTAIEISQMNFGKFSPGPQGGEIVLTPQSTVSVLGSVYAGNGLHNAASFYISGDVDAAYSITLPTIPVVLTNTLNAKTMLIEDWNSFPLPGVGTGKLQNGFQVVYVGATLKVGTLHDNPVGIYTGSYSITFEFN